MRAYVRKPFATVEGLLLSFARFDNLIVLFCAEAKKRQQKLVLTHFYC